ncbi:hypothetical protein EWM64_g5162 [Hericium alpestre]|uniref:Uncharacterized protein n=1 Tax=Hericium alpestre TaxID=135208 RepID=A0A4Y9ZXP8_9AGAM|nr:hypothetical protein EWM64_g5162 [Hericium alpestre]
MDRFLAPQSPEARAHSHVTENFYDWDVEAAYPNEAIIAGCASYQALDRYLNGADIMIMPQSRKGLESVLRRYSYDAIHNIIAKSRNSLRSGGYSRICHLCEESIRNVLDTGDNAATLLALHRPPPAEHHVPEHLSGRPIRTI